MPNVEGTSKYMENFIGILTTCITMMTRVHAQEAEHEFRHALHGLGHQALFALRLADDVPCMCGNTWLGPTHGGGNEDGHVGSQHVRQSDDVKAESAQLAMGTIV